MKVRVIGTEDCKHCRRIKNDYTAAGLDFEYLDGEADDIQDELDKMKLFNFPVIQIVEGDEVLWTTDPVIHKRGVCVLKVKRELERLQN